MSIKTHSRLIPFAASIIAMAKPPPKRNASQWADDSRILPRRSAEPGPWRSERVPWTPFIAEAIADPRFEEVYAWTGTQLSKTDGILLNTIGWKLTDNPVPILLICPTEKNAKKISSLRISPMIEATPVLYEGLEKGKREQKFLKTIGGVELAIGWAGSKTDMRSDSVGLVIADEIDTFEPIQGEGDVIGSLRARVSTFPGGKIIGASTATLGSIEAIRNDETGLSHWEPPGEDGELQSRIAALFFDGARAEWAVPCAGCDMYFVPRVSLLRWPEGASPMSARKNAWLQCPHCEHKNHERDKPDMNARGRFACPGQSIDKEGNISGPEPDNVIASFWVSGLMSPWVPLGKWAFDFVKAFKSADPDIVQTVVNQSGELYSVEGEKTDISIVTDLRMPYSFGEVPEGVIKITCGVDIGYLYMSYSVRGWGTDLTSWQIDAGELHGDTADDEIWQQLDNLLNMDYDSIPIHFVGIDSGFRTQEVYDFCRSRHNVIPTKGRDTLKDMPYYPSKIDYTSSGRRVPGGIVLWHFNTDIFKQALHKKYKIAAGDPGSFNLSRDAHDAYCRHLVSEQRIVDRKGNARWYAKGDNHWFDAEVINMLLARKEHFENLKPQSPRRMDRLPRERKKSNGWTEGLREQWG